MRSADRIAGRPRTAAAAALLLAAAGCWDPTGTAPAGFRYSDVSTGAEHTCGVSPEGAVYCWGAGERGQLGTGERRSRAFPVRVALDRAAQTVSAGGAHSCALTAAGEIWCWGANDHGQLGSGSASQSDRPVRVTGPSTYVAVASGRDHTCALEAGGAAFCWGRNDYGQLGIGAAQPAEDKQYPAEPVDGAAAAGGARAATRTLDVDEPTRVAGAHRFAQITAGAYHSCGVSLTGEAVCWGRNDLGQLGAGDQLPAAGPVLVAGGIAFLEISAGHLHTCAIATDRRGYCWGSNVHGEIGNGAIIPPSHSGGTRPRELISFGPGSVASLSAGVHTTCAVSTMGTTCWGRNRHGQLGIGVHVEHAWPQTVVFPERDHTVLVRVSARGDTHVCGLAMGGGVYCWGEGHKGQLGVGAAIALVPARVHGDGR